MELALGQYHRSGIFTVWKHASVFLSLSLLESTGILTRSALQGLPVGQRRRLGNRADQFHDGHVLQHDHLVGSLLSDHVLQRLSNGTALERLPSCVEYAVLRCCRRQRVPVLVAIG